MCASDTGPWRCWSWPLVMDVGFVNHACMHLPACLREEEEEEGNQIKEKEEGKLRQEEQIEELDGVGITHDIKAQSQTSGSSRQRTYTTSTGTGATSESPNHLEIIAK
jgi:hypothetical protein